MIICRLKFSGLVGISSEFIEVVIPAFNGEDLIKDCINSVTSALPDSRITVVNDCSSDMTSEIVSKEFPKVNIINNERNIGFGQSCNVGTFQSDRDWVLLLNQDANLINFDIDRVNELTQKKDVAVIGGRTEYRNGDLLPNIGLYPSIIRILLFWPSLPLRFIGLNTGSLYSNNLSDYESCSDVEWITGSCLLVRRDLFQDHGGFDKKFFIYVEEVDHAMRVQKNGYRVIFDPSIISMHENRAGIGLNSFSVFQTIRGQRIFLNSNYGKLISTIHMFSASISCIIIGLLASSLLWWSSKYFSSSWGLVRGGFRALFEGWSNIAGP